MASPRPSSNFLILEPFFPSDSMRKKMWPFFFRSLKCSRAFSTSFGLVGSQVILKSPVVSGVAMLGMAVSLTDLFPHPFRGRADGAVELETKPRAEFSEPGMVLPAVLVELEPEKAVVDGSGGVLFERQLAPAHREALVTQHLRRSRHAGIIARLPV